MKSEKEKRKFPGDWESEKIVNYKNPWNKNTAMTS
jgi:hypothetical protein